MTAGTATDPAGPVAAGEDPAAAGAPGTGAASAGGDAERTGDDAIRIRGLVKRYDRQGPIVLDGIDLTVAPGEFVCLLGASGCGKSTLLSITAGLEKPTLGTVELPLGPSAVMFQEASLFPWLTARRNVELALKLGGVASRDERRARAQELLASVNLSDAGDQRPHELSGGMRQRVALARALAQDRNVLLMDEPFAALDAITRDLLHEELTHVWRRTGRAIVFVTHNVREAARLGQRVLLMSSRPGRIAQEWNLDAEGVDRSDATQVAAAATEITARLREEIRRNAK